MLVSINSVSISDEISITATNLETILLAEDLYSKIGDEEEEVTFVFDPANMGHRKYLFKICQSQRAAKSKKSLGEMIEALPGCILSMGEGFIKK